MSLSIGQMQHEMLEVNKQNLHSFGHLDNMREITYGTVIEVSPDHTLAKVELNENDAMVYASISQHPNYWNIVGHLRPQDSVVVTVHKQRFDCHVLFRTHAKDKAFSDYATYKNNCTCAWSTMGA